jgi:hypothetical protein
MLATLLDDQSRIVTFDYNPLPLLRALADGHLPTTPGQPGTFEIELTADTPVTVNGVSLDTLTQLFTFH